MLLFIVNNCAKRRCVFCLDPSVEPAEEEVNSGATAAHHICPFYSFNLISCPKPFRNTIYTSCTHINDPKTSERHFLFFLIGFWILTLLLKHFSSVSCCFPLSINLWAALNGIGEARDQKMPQAIPKPPSDPRLQHVVRKLHYHLCRLMCSFVLLR